jgi:LysR family pca operon transcriptional activator
MYNIEIRFIDNGNAMNQLRGLKLRHLATFAEVARASSVSRAAEALGVAQPAVTRTLRELEDICDAELVVREGRGIRITPQGELFLRHAAAALAAARQGIAALKDIASIEGPPVRVGALPTVSAAMIPVAANAYLESGARNRLRITTGENRAMLDAIRQGELDLVVGRLPAPEHMAGLSFEPLYRDRVVLAVHAGHALAGHARVGAGDLLNWPMLIPQPGSIIRPFVDRLFLELGIDEPARVIETVSDSFGRAFLRRYPAIWVISRGVIASEIGSGEFVALPIDTETTLGSIGLVAREGTQLSPAAAVFADILRRTAPIDSSRPAV